MTVLVEHDNGFRGQHGNSEDNIATLDELPSLIQAGSCVYKLTILPNLEGKSWT